MRLPRVPHFSYPNPLHRLPHHYYQHRIDLKKPSTRVHDRAVPTDLLNLKYNPEIDRVDLVPDVPIEVIYPKESDQGLWGGEGIVKGFIKPRKYFQQGKPRPRYWIPNLKSAVYYSEILDMHFTFICTARTMALIDKHSGLDSYILRTPVQDLKSQLALLLRRKMLLTLAKKKFKNDTHEKEMLEKYGDTMIPIEQAQWIGLSPSSALKKQMLESAKEEAVRPLKYKLSKKLVQEIKDKKFEEPDRKSKQRSLLQIIKSQFGMERR